jgi:hypothetical protein
MLCERAHPVALGVALHQLDAFGEAAVRSPQRCSRCFLLAFRRIRRRENSRRNIPIGTGVAC